MPEPPPVATAGTLTVVVVVTVDTVAVEFTKACLSVHTAADVTGITLVADIVATVVSPKGALPAAAAAHTNQPFPVREISKLSHAKVNWIRTSNC